MKNYALWYLACRDKSPKGDEQLAGQRDDRSFALFALSDTCLEPLGESTIFGALGSARRAESCRDVRAHYQLSPVLSRAVADRFRLESP
jgi:hypothetical protein